MNKKMKQTIKTLTTSIILASCMQGNLLAAESAPESHPVLVTINGQPITDIQVLAFNALQGANASKLDSQEAQITLLNQLVNTTLLAQLAEKEGMDQIPQIKASLEMAKIQVLAEAKVNDYLSKIKVTDEEIKDAYDKTFTDDALMEYKVSHILVSEEKEANDIIAALDKGEKFADLAKTHSLDGSKEMGGELGWIGKNQVVGSFADAMAKMKKGTHSATPVKTQFGWHIILLEDTRKQEPPPLEKVKKQFEAKIKEQKLAAYLSKLRNSAKIEVAGAKQDKAAPESKATPAPAPAPAGK